MRMTKLSGHAKANPGADEFNAYYVPMVQTSDVTANRSHYTLPTAGGPSVMITSKLSGCTFGVGSDATGAKLVSHVQPNLDLPKGNQRKQNLATSVGSGFNAVEGAFRSGEEYAETGAVIGCRTGVAWKFYLQATDYAEEAHQIDNVTVID